MHLAVLTIMPEVFHAYMAQSIMKRAVDNAILKADIYNLRDFAKDRHRTVDDTPYGGGPGMVMKPEPFSDAIEHIRADGLETHAIMLTPQGRPFDQKRAEELSKEKRRLLFLCGRYEGVDDRVRQLYADEEISVGDFVLTGGELAALVIIDAVVRLLPGAVGDEKSLQKESFSWGLLDYPHFTRPPEWRGLRVPGALLSGNHAQIERWRRKEAIRLTLQRRPDLLEKAVLSDDDIVLLKEIEEE